jgi:hypothetical protein
MIDFQSPATARWLCPSGTFENSPAIYGWVRCLLKIKSPEGTTEILPCLIGLKYRVPDITSTSAPLRYLSTQINPPNDKIPAKYQPIPAKK